MASLTDNGMFASRRLKLRIYPTLRTEIGTKSNLITQKVERKKYRVLAHVFIVFISLQIRVIHFIRY